MSEIAGRYRRLSEQFATTISSVPAGAWSNPSPCEEWVARDVVRHVVQTQGMFLGFIGETLDDVPSVDDDPAGAWNTARAQVQAALDDPARANAEFDGFFGRTSFANAVERFLNTDLVLHRWDLARATGQDDTIDSGDAERILRYGHEFGDTIRSPGVAGPEVPVAADADVQTRALGFWGRAS